MIDFAPPMMSMTYDRGAKPFVSLCEMNPVDFAGFPPRRGPKTQGPRNRPRRPGSHSASCATSDSEMAPQVPGLAQNGLGNGADAQSLAGESIPSQPRCRDRPLPHMDHGRRVGMEAPPARLSVKESDDP